METANLPSVVSLGLKQPSQLEQCKNFASTSYTVDVGQNLFTKPLKPDNLDQLQTHSVKLEDTDFDYDIEYSTDHVPLGEILDRLQNEERFEPNDKSNLIRLHAANDSSNAATISATLNFTTLDLSHQSNIQSQLSEINDVLFSITKPETSAPLAISTASSPLPVSVSVAGPSSLESLSPPSHAVPDVNSMFCASPSPASSDTDAAKPSGLLNVLAASPQSSSISFSGVGAEAKVSPQECNLCNKMFGNASALAKHRLTHSDERKYLCTVCHKAFKRQDHLNGHLLTHRNKKPFECNAQGCNKSYCDARSLRRHRENHHSSSKDDKLVSPASSIASSGDFDDKSLGSESCDGSIKGTKLVFTGINSLEKEKLTKITTDTQQFQLIEQILRESKECSESAIQVKTAPRPRHRPTSQFPQQPVITQRTNSTTSQTTKQEPDPAQNMVECSICSRKFKNIPALNGHMRLHGGYYRKDGDKNKQQQQQAQQQQQQHQQQIQSDNSKVLASPDPSSSHRVSSNVISLIEEKIIQKRKLEPSPGRAVTPSSSPAPRFTFLTSPSSSSSSSSVCVSLPSSSISSLSSTSPVTVTQPQPPATLLEPPTKRLALDTKPPVTSLVFPLLPQPDTDKLLANLAAKQQPRPPLTPSTPLTPVSPHPSLPSVPLPEIRCSQASSALSPGLLCLPSPVPVGVNKESQVKSAHQQKLLKIQRTNFQPRIGEDHQAALPELRSRSEDAKYGLVTEDSLLWSPHLDAKFSEAEFDAYLRLALSSAVRDTGNSSVESGLYTLLLSGGNISQASQKLLGHTKLEDSLSSPLSSNWTPAELDMFYEALCKHKKDFAKIAGDLPNKSIKDCVEFYYLWKNICREESQSFKSIINDSSDEIHSSDILAI